MSTRRTSKLGSLRRHSHLTREHRFVMARGLAVLLSARSRDPAISRRVYTHTSVSSVSANPSSASPHLTKGMRRLMTCRIVLISNDRLLRNQHKGPPCRGGFSDRLLGLNYCLGRNLSSIRGNYMYHFD